MKPRVIFRTHYQVDEPALVKLLVVKATSPTRSEYDETVADRLAKIVKSFDKDFNVAAAGYALDLARALSVVSEQNSWTADGQLVNLVAEVGEGPWEDELVLSDKERLLHFKLFLEADGAAFLWLGKRLLEHGSLPNSDGDWNTLARDLFTDIYADYLSLSATTADRVALRSQLDRIKNRGYTGKSGSHKIFVHLQAMYRLGLIQRESAGTSRQYVVSQEKRDGLAALVREVASNANLEHLIKARAWITVAAHVYHAGGRRSEFDSQGFLNMLAELYRRVTATGVSLCPLSTLIEKVQIDLLTREGLILEYDIALAMLQEIQKEHVGEVRFHVDRNGKPAFLKLSDHFIESLAS